ncbi:hypothetical protein, partial [Oleiphilus sp. HI0123]|uniref:class I SAM-dependent methyltransferase n=2 Tax=unclassified Oleiphilus TaxID=2631174 RepID=UPI000A6C34A0
MVSARELFLQHANLVDSKYGDSESVSVATLNKELINELLGLIDNSNEHEHEHEHEQVVDNDLPIFSVDDLLVDHHAYDVVEKLGQTQDAHDLYPNRVIPVVIRKLHNFLREEFSSQVKSPFVYVNTRAWTTKPGTERFGPNAMHLDGLEAGHLKIMVYLTPLNKESGYLVIGNDEIKDVPAGLCVMFKNSDISHSGVPGLSLGRTCIEVTLMRALVDLPQLWLGHHFGRHLVDPSIAYLRASELINDQTKIQEKQPLFPTDKLKINIGSGRRDWSEWTCFDEINSPGVTNLVLNETVKLPIENQSVGLAYSSHAFEHLPDNTIFRIMWELRRVLCVGGVFLLKIPDFDWFVGEYLKGSDECMVNKGVESITYTWERKGLLDNLQNRVSMMFCGYWNSQYGDHFSGNIDRNNKAAYHGPAVMNEAFIDQLFRECSPNQIARTMCKVALSDPDFYRFNHQNAWSKEEVVNMFTEFGFSLVSTDRDEIKKDFGAHIP